MALAVLPGRFFSDQFTRFMNSKDIVRQALAHRTGRVPVDFGSTAVSGIHVSVVEALRRHYGLSAGPIRVTEPYQMLGEVTDDLRFDYSEEELGFWFDDSTQKEVLRVYLYDLP